MKYFSICIDGIDKTGKDTLLGFIDLLSNHKYVINVRGMLSQLAFAELFNREYNYDISIQQYILNVLLTANKEDWEVRCKLTKEPKINYEINCIAFEKAYKLLKENNLPVVRYNTSEMTPFMIAKEIIKYLEKLDEEK